MGVNIWQTNKLHSKLEWMRVGFIYMCLWLAKRRNRFHFLHGDYPSLDIYQWPAPNRLLALSVRLKREGELPYGDM